MSLSQGEILGLLGPNGVGKSTIFNIIIGLLKPNYGSVFIEKKNVTQDPIFYRTKNYKIGYVPQHGGRPPPWPFWLGGWSFLDTFMI